MKGGVGVLSHHRTASTHQRVFPSCTERAADPGVDLGECWRSASELVEERQRRGCVERILRATAGTLFVDPSVMGRAFTQLHDQYAAERLVEVAAGTVRDVARMQSKADVSGKRLLTFTLEAEIRFAEPGDVHSFTDALTEAVRQTIESFDTEGGRPYRLIAGGHPKPAEAKEHQP